MKKKLPSIIVNCGDPAGVGLDLIVFLANQKFPAFLTILANKEALIERSKIHQKKISFSKNLLPHLGDGSLFLKDVSYPKRVVPGKPNKENSHAQLTMIDYAVKNCLNKNYSALVTLPISKEILSTQLKKFTGHTEYISELVNNGCQEVMMLAHKNLKVALVTTHIALSDVPKHITKDKLITVLTTLNKDLKNRFKIKSPRIAITGLNPHAGEGGEFGKEEQNIISPVISSMIKKGLNLEGPLPADTAFTPDKIKETDCFLTMFHDQGLAPFKALSFGRGVNITLGLPFIRTSVDHGTAFDIVGTQKINASSFYEAIDKAIQLSQ
jgi:4-hydroxythreonine-4-phosphate dehydrogenase